MLSELIANLQHIDAELSAEDVADAIWLAAHIGDQTEEPVSETTSSSDSDSAPPNKNDTTVVTQKHQTAPLSASSDVYLRSEVERKREGKQLLMLPLRSPTVPALLHSLELARSLRPFSTLVPDSKRKALDEEATADRIAESDVWIPVLNHLLTHWFDVALVVDIGASMTIWRQTITDLYLLLACHGAFRDVRLWELDTNAQDEVYLYAGTGGDSQRQARDERELIDTSKRRLILLVTDCVSPAWHSGRIAEVLAGWGEYNVVTLVQVLPQTLWLRTALNAETPIRLQAPSPGCINTQFSFQSTSFWDDEDTPGQLVPIPIVTLEPEALLAWAQVVARAEDRWIPGYLLATTAEKQAESDEYEQELLAEETSSASLSALELVQYFRATASSAARRLAGLLAMVPISMPVVRIVQQTMFLKPRQVDVAEIFLSGLLKVVSSGDGNPDEVQYDFVESVREILLDTVPINEGVRVLHEISDFIEKKYNQVLDFAALIANPAASEGITINEKSRPFASVAAQALRRFGEPYRSLAYRLEEVIIVPPDKSPLVLEPAGSVAATSEQIETLQPVPSTALVDSAPVEEPQPVLSNEPPSLDKTADFHQQLVVEKQRRMGLSPFVKCICPSCFAEIYLGDCAIVSGLNNTVFKKESKSPLARMRVEPLDGPKYTLADAHRVCTNCGYYLPYNIELVPSLTLAITGDVSSGKSHYIAALIHQLKTEWISNAQGLARLTSLTPEVEKEYTDEYFEPLFYNKQALLPTQTVTSSLAKPLIYKLVISPSPKHSPISFNLMIYDASGADFSEQRLAKFAQFVLHASALIFVADPLTMIPIMSQLPPSLQSGFQQANIAQRKRASESFNNIINIFARYRGQIDRATLPDTPIAIMLSKADLLKYINPPDSYSFWNNPIYGDDLDLRDISRVDQEIRDLLVKYEQSDLLTAAHRFKHVSFFATSATGEPSDTNGKFQNVEPCRCLDPFLWILYKLGMIRASL